jgi:predicted membrane channel-forming protein YqfA (hemolysin III family)
MPKASYEEFLDFAEQVIHAMECRRREYKAAFFIRLFIILGLIAVISFLPLQNLFAETSLIAKICYGLLAFFFGSLYLLAPVRDYRHKPDYFDLTPSVKDRFPGYADYIV